MPHFSGDEIECLTFEGKLLSERLTNLTGDSPLQSDNKSAKIKWHFSHFSLHMKNEKISVNKKINFWIIFFFHFPFEKSR